MSSLFRAAAAAAESLLNAADESAASVLSTPQKTQQQKHNEQDSRLNSNPALAQTPPALLSLNDATAHAATLHSDVPLSSPAAAPNPLQFRADPGKGALMHAPAADDIDFEAILRAEETPPASAKKQQQPKSALQSPAPSSLPTSSRAQTAKTSLLDQLSGGRDIVELLGENELLRGELLSLRASSDASSKKLTAKLSAAQVQLDELQARHEATLARAVDEAATTEGRLSARVRDLEAANLQATRLAAAAQAAASAAELQVSVQKDSLIRLQSSLDDVSQQLDDARDAARTAAADADARAAAERERFLKTIAGLREAEAAATRDREQLSAAAVDANKKSAAAASLAAELRDRANMADSAAAAAAAEAAAARLESEGLRQSAAEAAAAAAATSAAARDERSKLESRIAALQQQLAQAHASALAATAQEVASSESKLSKVDESALHDLKAEAAALTQALQQQRQACEQLAVEKCALQARLEASAARSRSLEDQVLAAASRVTHVSQSSHSTLVDIDDPKSRSFSERSGFGGGSFDGNILEAIDGTSGKFL